MAEPIAEPVAEPTIAELLARSFALIEDRRPAAWSHLSAALGQRRVEIQLERERFWVGSSEAGLVLACAGPVDVSISTDTATILAILDAELELSGAVRDDRLRVCGSLEHVAAVHDAIVAYVHAGVRCPGFPQLLGQLRRRVTAGLDARAFTHSDHTREREHDGQPRT